MASGVLSVGGMSRATLTAVALGLVLAGCGGDDGAGPDAAGPMPDAFVDQAGPLFAPDHVVEVEIQIAAADWDQLRVQARSVTTLFGNCLAQPFEDPFTYFHAQVTVDGETFADVGLRKKGFLGSLDPDRPSLKVKLDEYVDDQRYLGEKTLTLNNAKQDPSYLRQCLSYQTFTAAGVPAARCNFAHVTVNGTDLGVYVNVEAGNKDFLRRAFDDPDGNLYEGTLSDFRAGWTGTFELKTNESANDRSDLDALVAALEVPDGELLAALDPILDVDEFLSFWATEILITHWDGYAGNANNFLAYHEPRSGKFQFVPWGTDGTLSGAQNPFGDESSTAVQANSLLARRLYLLPETRDRYLARLRAILENTWDEPALLAEIDRMEDLLAPIVTTPDFAAAVEGVRGFVRGRRAVIDAELASGPPALTGELRDPPCFETLGPINGSFATTWGTIGAPDPWAAGTGTLAATLDGVPLSVVQVGSTAGLDTNAMPPAAQVAVVAWLADGTAELVVLQIQPAAFVGGTTIPIDLEVSFGAVYHYTPSPQALELVGLVAEGSIDLDQGAQAVGAPVTGSFTGTVIRSPF
jgi:spore coat protein H